MTKDTEYRLVHIGERITAAREKNGLTERELAAKTGVTEREVHSWEASESRPEVWQVLDLAEQCGVTPDWLLGKDLIEEFLMEYGDKYFVCFGPGSSFDDLPLEELDPLREFLLDRNRRTGSRRIILSYYSPQSAG